MANTPLVTVICLCYNHEAYVTAALNSVLDQTYTNIQLIIADDCSADHSQEVIQNWLKDHPEIPFFSNAENLGNTKTFNTAYKLAQGDFIVDLAADDVLLPDCVAKQLEGFAASKFTNVGLVYGNAELISENGSFIRDYFKTDSNRKRVNLQPTGNIYIGFLNGTNHLCSVSAMYKREVFEKLGGYDENLAYEDYDFWIRASRIYEFDYIDEILVQKRVLEDSLYSMFLEKRNKKTRKFNRSTYLILVKAFHLNQSKEEYTAMLKRIHFEMTVAYRTQDFLLLSKYVVLEVRVRLKIKTKGRAISDNFDGFKPQ